MHGAKTASAVVAALALAAPASGTQHDARPGSLWKAFMCIHSHEADWQDDGSPYYGGLQMDYTFMSTYGPEYLRAWGTANNWPPAVQMSVAIKAYLSGRGFGPWPNTRRLCGV